MIKKVLIIFSIFLILCTYTVVAQEEIVSDKAYSCLENKVAGNCGSLSTEEQILSLLTIDRCKTEVLESSDDNECWPASACKVKTTAQAILALNSVGTQTIEAENWLLSKEVAPSGVDWLLQIESEPTQCSITYQGKSFLISVDEDRTLSGGAGTCLTLSDNEYWLEISPTCTNEEFEISCSATFLTSLLYKEEGSDVIYVMKGSNSASAGGTTTEKVNSFCFKQGASCNYEGTLWAALVLDFKGYDTSAYLPYLITSKDENRQYIPESFLYSLTNNFKDELLLKQRSEQWWSESGDRYYDTAVALMSLQNEEPQEKKNAIDWLEETQDSKGCWSDNLRNTALLVYSLWPKKVVSIPSGDSSSDCEDSGYFCLSSAACSESGGNTLQDYSGCFGTNICCSTDRLLESCLLQGGEKCDSDESCVGGTFADAADSEKCCVGGDCKEIEEPEETRPECERYGGECKSFCSDNEEISSYDCPSIDTCCIKTSSSKNYTMIIVLLILITLTILGIIFRKRLRKIFSKFKGKSAPSAQTKPRRFPPGPSSSIGRRTTPRRVLTKGQRRPVRRPSQQKPRGEIDDVLKKLKDMGK